MKKGDGEQWRKNMAMSKVNLIASTDEDDLNFYVKGSILKKFLPSHKVLDHAYELQDNSYDDPLKRR